MQLVPRKNKVVTETATITVENTIVSTITEHVNTTVYSSFFYTKTMTATINHTITETPKTTLQASGASLRGPATPVRLTSTISRTTKAAASTSDTVSGKEVPDNGSHLGPGPVVGIVMGSLIFLALVAGALFFGRRMLQKYRRQRVARKEAQTESNDMPPGLGYGQTERNVGALEHQSTGGTYPSYQMTGTSSSSMPRPLTSHHTEYPPEKQDALWEEPPPSYPA